MFNSIEQYGPTITKLLLSSDACRVGDHLMLSVFKWERRKGWDVLLDAYWTQFNTKDSVCLVIKTYETWSMSFCKLSYNNCHILRLFIQPPLDMPLASLMHTVEGVFEGPSNVTLLKVIHILQRTRCLE